MSIFTIFFCGTGSNRNDSTPNAAIENKDKNSAWFFHDGELISTLAKNMATPEFYNWIIVDGPGSGNLQEENKWIKPGNHSNMAGQLFGNGWENNVEHALAVLKADPFFFAQQEGYHTQKKQFQIRTTNSQPIEVVNLVGWSRGGVTCHMMANAMAKDPKLRHIKVNIFAIDPVPGLFQFAEHRTKIKPNVHDYYAVYARHEASVGFTPVMPNNLDVRGKIAIYAMPGRHATVVGNASETGDGVKNLPTDFTDPGKVVRCLVEKQLTCWGVKLNNTLSLTDEAILQHYDTMLADLPKYLLMRKNVYTVRDYFSTERKVGNESQNKKWSELSMLASPSFNGKNIFINQHHMNLFINYQSRMGLKETDMAKKFPITYQLIAEI